MAFRLSTTCRNAGCDGIVDAIPSWGQTRLISDILDTYRKRTLQQEADAKELAAVK